MSWSGMNKSDGSTISDIDHIRQSITDILTTPVGSRVMRRLYGSDIFVLLDSPMNGATKLRLMAATVMAIINWEPRVKITSMNMTVATNGDVVIYVEFERQDGHRLKSGVTVNLGVAS